MWLTPGPVNSAATAWTPSRKPVAVLLEKSGPIGLPAAIVAGVLLVLGALLNMLGPRELHHRGPGVDLEGISSGRVRDVPGESSASEREPRDGE